MMKTRMRVYGTVLLTCSLVSPLNAQNVYVSSPVPEPSPIVLAGVGAAVLWLWLFWRGVD